MTSATMSVSSGVIFCAKTLKILRIAAVLIILFVSCCSADKLAEFLIIWITCSNNESSSASVAASFSNSRSASSITAWRRSVFDTVFAIRSRYSENRKVQGIRVSSISAFRLLCMRITAA